LRASWSRASVFPSHCCFHFELQFLFSFVRQVFVPLFWLLRAPLQLAGVTVTRPPPLFFAQSSVLPRRSFPSSLSWAFFPPFPDFSGLRSVDAGWVFTCSHSCPTFHPPKLMGVLTRISEFRLCFFNRLFLNLFHCRFRRVLSCYLFFFCRLYLLSSQTLAKPSSTRGHFLLLV